MSFELTSYLRKQSPISNQCNEDGEKDHLYQCPRCEFFISLPTIGNEVQILTCPKCGFRGIIPKEYKKDTSKKFGQENLFKKSYWLLQPLLRAKLIGFFVLVGGFFCLLNPTEVNIKISIALFFVGFLFFLIISERNAYVCSKIFKNKLLMSEMITLLIIIITIIVFFITDPKDYEQFLIILYLGLLIMRELVDKFLPIHVKQRLNIAVIILLVISIIIVTKRILNIFGS